MDSVTRNRPNVVWIMSDQHRAQALGWNHDPNLSTPAIDNLARSGVVFSNAVAGTPWCTPFRSALLTGMYPHQNGCSSTPSRLDPRLSTVAHAFNQAGYHTAWVGKWHLAGSNSATHHVPVDERGGFAYWRGYENNNKQNDVWVYGGESEEPERLPDYETRSLSRVFLNHLGDHVSRKPETPFFAVLSVQPPHSPYVPPFGRDTRSPATVHLRPNVPVSKRVQEKARRDIAGYAAMVEEVDSMVADVWAGLKDLGVDRETYIIYLSDHGDMLGSHGQWEKSSPWEESIRIPFVVGCTGAQSHIQVGEVDHPLNHIDIAPTSLGLCGIDTPEAMVGYDFSHMIVHPKRQFPRHEEVASAPPQAAYLQQVPRKYHANSVNRAWRGIVTKDGWKYICTPDNDWLMFDLNDDPYEMNNLCYNTVYQSQKEKLHDELVRFIADTGDEFPLPDVRLNR